MSFPAKAFDELWQQVTNLSKQHCDAQEKYDKMKHERDEIANMLQIVSEERDTAVNKLAMVHRLCKQRTTLQNHIRQLNDKFTSARNVYTSLLRFLGLLVVTASTIFN